jgi:hypothetical protein
MKDYPKWFDEFVTKLTDSINLISMSGSEMGDDKIKPRSAKAHLEAAIVLLESARDSIKKFIDK